MIKAGEINGVYAWHPDRLYRSMRDLEDLVDLVDANDLLVRTVRAGEIDLGTASGRMMARVVGSMARYESEHKADRQARKHTELAEAGKPSGGGRRPIGYEADQVTINPTEADAIRVAAQEILAGETVAAAARNMSARLGRTVKPTILRGILTGPRVAGMRQHVPMADRRRGVTAGKLTQATWPAILDDKTWTDLRNILLDPRRRKTRPPRTHLLTSVLRCGICGYPLLGGNGAYKCATSHGGCGRIGVTMAPVEAIVTEWVRSIIDDPQVTAWLTAALHPPAANETHDTTAAIKARQETLAKMFADGDIDADEWRVARDQLDMRLTSAQTYDAESSHRAQIASRTASVLEAWDEASTAERRAAIGAVLKAKGLQIVIQERSRRNGPKFDPGRISIQPA
jgi:hypothetical protein